MRLLFNIFLIAVFANCAEPVSKEGTKTKEGVYFEDGKDSVKTGGVKILTVQTPKGPFKIWTKRVGNNPKIKLLLLNGGPGCTHEYFECFESYLPKEGIEFIYYDQLGCGNSDNPNDTSLWDLSRFVDEVDQVATQLNLSKDNFYLLGHSWGGIVAMEYAIKHQQKLKGLIISNMMCNAVEYGQYAEKVLSKDIEPTALKEIRDIEARKDFSNPRYMELLMPQFYAKHICRLPLVSWPEPMSRSLNKINQSLYVTMQGPSEFGISGKLSQWNCAPRIRKISVPTLVIGARYDTMDPAHMEWISKTVKNGTFLYCPRGSHMCMWDDQETYFAGLVKFLTRGN